MAGKHRERWVTDYLMDMIYEIGLPRVYAHAVTDKSMTDTNTYLLMDL